MGQRYVRVEPIVDRGRYFLNRAIKPRLVFRFGGVPDVVSKKNGSQQARKQDKVRKQSSSVIR